MIFIGIKPGLNGVVADGVGVFLKMDSEPCRNEEGEGYGVDSRFFLQSQVFIL